MAKNWAIVIGINQYRFLQPLRYAKRDAELMQNFLLNDAGFDRVFFFSDDSSPLGDKSTEPFRTNLLRVMRQIFEQPFMGAGDNFWFFFSGHGIRYDDRDYLMPLDGDSEDVENTGIATHDITDRLRRCGADNIVMMLDACRNDSKKSGQGIGRQTEEEARRTGVISIFSCSPDQYSYEIEAIQQGAFTAALLEGLGIRGRCATVERLNQYLENRVPEIVRQHHSKAQQTPYTIAEPIGRSNLILIPKHADFSDIATLKNDAYQAEVSQNVALAEQLWIRVLAAASGQDMDAVRALQRIERSRLGNTDQSYVVDQTQTGSVKGENSGTLPLLVFQAVRRSINRAIEATPGYLIGSILLLIAVLWIRKTGGAFSFNQTTPPVGQVPTPVISERPTSGQTPDDRLSFQTPSISSSLQSFEVNDLTAFAIKNFSQGNLQTGNQAVEALLDRGAITAAETAFASVPANQRDIPEINFLHGRIAWQSIARGNRNYDPGDPRRYWEAATQGKPDPLYFNALGFAYYAEGNLQRATDAWFQSLKLSEEQKKNGAPSQDVLTAYAGLALASLKSASSQPPAQKVRLRGEAVKLRDRVNKSSPDSFLPGTLYRNWLWTEAAIADWKALQAIK
ncbi:caspase domain-containing protein [Phormidesmis sp. 146-12]